MEHKSLIFQPQVIGKRTQLINMTNEYFYIDTIIGGVSVISDCDGGLCFQEKTTCEKFAQRIILNSVNTNITAMCKRIEP